MPRRQPLPRIWLMTDPRIVDLSGAIAQLPRRSGIIVRHYHLAPPARFRLLKHVQRLARRGRHIVLLADTPWRARAWGADGAHDRSSRPSRGFRSMAVHSMREAAMARRMRADLALVSPAFATASHPDVRPLKRHMLARLSRCLRTIALGGMTARRFRTLRSLNLYGWAGIDALRAPRRQNLKAVPI